MTSAATTIAAVAAAIHRRTGNERMNVLYRDADGVRGPLEVDVSGDPTLVALAERVAAQWDAAQPEMDFYGDARSVDVEILAADAGTEEAGAVLTVRPADDTTVARQARQAAAQPDLTLSRLDLLTEGDEATVRGFMAGPPAKELRPAPVLIAERAASTPDAVALSRGDDQVTYRELMERSGALAGELLAAGVRTGSVVAVLMPRSPEAVIALLGVMRAGGAYLAVDLNDPTDRVHRLLATADVRVAVTGQDLAVRLPGNVRAIPFGATTGTTTPPELPELDQESPAYISFTSGTTGQPRGVLVPHRAISRLVAEPDWIAPVPGDVFLQAAPLAFDAATLELWAPLVHGARLAVLPAGPMDLDILADTLAAEKVSVLWLTAGLFHQLVAARPQALAGVRHLIAGGDVISPAHLNHLLAAVPGLTFTNGYGPTENTTFTACWTADGPTGGAPVPIGRPIAGTSVAVLDSRMRLVPVGVRGELFAGGEGVALGYIGDPAATDERFLPNPFADEPGRRIYRTGDLASWTEDGVLLFHGRGDGQVKVRGYRVEPGAVEATLLAHPDVRLAAVVAQRAPSGDVRLIAYVEARGEAARNPADLAVRLRADLATTLPAYSLPAAILIRDALPLTVSGKVDRRALPASSAIARSVANEYVPARDSLEQRLTQIWGEALNVEPVGVEDDFFELGGHSLLAAELLNQMKREFQVKLPARTLYLQPTIGELAAQIADLSRETTRDDV
ncbi:amino acid adenylation domain-containing protein [Streptomyces sp. NPDC048448]|uniref:amino acid adenylation domain-containing protein n=1 Tax=Streptomyces sp. NPDC048448 TaxID=3365554 RepID=UPI0037127787